MSANAPEVEVEVEVEGGVEAERELADGQGYASARGPFAIFENPPFARPRPPEQIDGERAAAGFDFQELAQKYGEEPARQKLGEMLEAYGDGTSVNVLFWQDGPHGMSLVHAWFGPNLPLFRHSHPAYGDCLYYVVAGEILLGKRRLGPGSGFFIPNGMPYKYTAGPEGVEVLEFRAGGGEKGAPGMRIHERTLDALQRIIDVSNANRPSWKAPERIGDTPAPPRERE